MGGKQYENEKNQPSFEIEDVVQLEDLVGPFGSWQEDFKITVSPTATGFGKPEPYNNETTWEWQLEDIRYTDKTTWEWSRLQYIKYTVCVYDTSLVDIDDCVFSARTGKIVQYKGKGGNVIIPGEVNGAIVTGIGERAFEGCSEVTSITIPQGVTSIYHHAFADCKGLKSVTMPKSLTCIGRYAFYGCSSMTSISIPESITSIGYLAFYSCSALTSISMPESMNCSIGESAFSGCSALTSISIPKGVTNIGEYAFNVCSALTSITIPGSVTSIGVTSFHGCRELSSVLFLGNQPLNISGSTFDLPKKDFKIYVLPTATGFGKPEPYNNETSWNWRPSPYYSDTYEVVIAGASFSS